MESSGVCFAADIVSIEDSKRIKSMRQAIRIRGIPRHHLVLVLTLALLTLGNCQRATHAASDVLVAVAVTPPPLTRGPAMVTVTLSDAARAPIRGAHVTLEGDMTHAGMAPVNAPAPERDPGSYVATLPLMMSGDWIVVVSAQLPDGRTLERPVALGTVP